MLIHAYVDDIFKKLMDSLNLEIPSYNFAQDPTKSKSLIEYTLTAQDVKAVRHLYRLKLKEQKKVAKRKFDELT